uniref:Uncharacterized protein n=1 Tax=Panagrolaimus sp. JU765 TaxID=591449 RepID=A0AC34RIX9_9BILA
FFTEMPYYWTSTDSRNVALASVIPAGLGIANLLSSRENKPYYNFIKNSTKPNWADISPTIHGVVDLLALSPLGYASYLVYKYGGGFDYTDTTIALTLFGTNLVASGLAIPLFAKREYKKIAIVKSIIFGTALATFVAFRQIDAKAGLLVLPYTAWTAFCAFFAYKLYNLNHVKYE